MSGIMLAMNLSGCSFFVKKDSGNTDIQSVRQESENADKTVMKRSKSEEKEAEEKRTARTTASQIPEDRVHRQHSISYNHYYFCDSNSNS